MRARLLALALSTLPSLLLAQEGPKATPEVVVLKAARLSYGAIQLRAGDPVAAQKVLAEVEQEASRRGFLLIASQVEVLRKALAPKLG